MENKTVTLKITYDKGVDAAYLYFTQVGPGQAQETYTCDDLPSKVNGDINIDFGDNGDMLGLEILQASKVLPSNILTELASE